MCVCVCVCVCTQRHTHALTQKHELHWMNKKGGKRPTWGGKKKRINTPPPIFFWFLSFRPFSPLLSLAPCWVSNNVTEMITAVPFQESKTHTQSGPRRADVTFFHSSQSCISLSSSCSLLLLPFSRLCGPCRTTLWDTTIFRVATKQLFLSTRYVGIW